MRKGQKVSEETKEKLREARINHGPISDETRTKMSKAHKGKKMSDESKQKVSEAHRGKMVSDETRRKLSESHKDKVHSKDALKKMSEAQAGCRNPSWRGGVKDGNIPLYDTFASRIAIADDVRQSPDSQGILEVRCTYCGKWYVPKATHVVNRIASIDGRMRGENRFYCSDGCKSQCSIYQQKKYPKGFKPATSREVQPELRKMVFERDNFACQKCGKTERLHCHHIDPVAQNPLESADVDSCTTLCKECHGEAHKGFGCRYIDLQCKKAV